MANPRSRRATRPARGSVPDRETKSERESTDQAISETRKRERRERGGTLAWLWQNYSLSLMLLALTLITLVIHAIFGWLQYSADQFSHGQTAEVWGPDGYWLYFGEWTFQNWQSEFLEALVMVSFTSWFIHRGSPESKDGQAETSIALSRIEQRLERIEEATR